MLKKTIKKGVSLIFFIITILVDKQSAEINYVFIKQVGITFLGIQ